MSFVVSEDLGNLAGCVVWWSLSGRCLAETVRGMMDLDGLDAVDGPKDASSIVVAGRAIADCLQSNHLSRQLLRPLRLRGHWEIVEEHVVPRGEHDEESAPHRLRHVRLAQVQFDRDGLPPRFQHLHPPGTPELERSQSLEQAARAAFEQTKGELDANDMSTWLTWYVHNRLSAVSLRERGGFYFIPREHRANLLALKDVLERSGQNRVYTVPAARTAELVDGVIHALRVEAEAELSKMEQYLAGTVSTRGLNATERDAESVRDKLRSYTNLLGAGLGDLTDRLSNLDGAVQAARILAEQERRRLDAEAAQ